VTTVTPVAKQPRASRNVRGSLPVRYSRVAGGSLIAASYRSAPPPLSPRRRAVEQRLRGQREEFGRLLGADETREQRHGFVEVRHRRHRCDLGVEQGGEERV